ncbi:aminotransferase class V-fold PLP-dependent enzyme [Rhodobacteraceae bacterium NNCM2]|nr:aminotransferase class V-fold PLP-dependent enzyme [Coraliihabitans acroporae]
MAIADLNESEIEALRGDVPSCTSVIHANNAGASPIPEPVHQAVLSHLMLERRVGGYAARDLAAEEVDGFYTEMAGLLGAAPDEIAFVENATRAWDMAFYAIPLKPGDRVLTHGNAEYVSNYLGLLQSARRRGIEIDLAPSDVTGQLDLAAMEAMIGPRTRLIAVTHVPTHCGLVNPAEAVGVIARRHGIPYLLDACQSAGQVPIDVGRIGCDMLSGTGRKFLRGSRGTGFLYVRKELAETLEPPFVDLRAATWTKPGEYELAAGARRFETWEGNTAGKIGLARAVRYARDIGVERIERRIGLVAGRLRAGLSAMPTIEMHDPGEKHCGIVTFRRMDEEPEVTVQRLKERRIMTSVARTDMARLDFEASGLTALVRVSLHAFNTEEEVARILEAVVAND